MFSSLFTARLNSMFNVYTWVKIAFFQWNRHPSTATSSMSSLQVLMTAASSKSRITLSGFDSTKENKRVYTAAVFKGKMHRLQERHVYPVNQKCRTFVQSLMVHRQMYHRHFGLSYSPGHSDQTLRKTPPLVFHPPFPPFSGRVFH